ncbi:MAG TPA: MFS transporter, partial [Candidatus Peribacteria bacterium]|nr:MFS transporter [Candidatus Peribacteria bacterium]
MRPKSSAWLVFWLVAVAQFMVVLDSAITNVALPAIKESLNFDASTLQWVVTSYALTFGGFLLLGGRASDLFGHRRILMWGLGAFTFFSLLIGLSNSSAMLIVLRAFQGVSAAFMSPAALSIVLITFAEGGKRNQALSYWTTISTGGATVGLLLGGLLTQYVGWRMNFFVNVPIGIGILVAMAKLLPAHDTTADHSELDLPGAVLVTAGLTLFVYVISQAPAWGWLSGMTIGSGSLAVALLALFLWNESRQKHPLMPLSIFTKRNVMGANIMMAPIMAGMFGMFFLISLYIQSVLNYSPLIAGLSFLPFPLILGVLSTRVAPYVTKYGFKPFLIAGPVIVAISMLWMVRLTVDGNYWVDILPSIMLMPVGLAITFMPIMIAATSGVAKDEAGLAAGLINTSQQMGGALGLAILSSVAASVTAAHIAGGDGQLAALVAGYDRAFLFGV